PLLRDGGFHSVGYRIDARVRRDQRRLRHRERGVQKRDTGGGLGVKTGHFLVGVLVRDQGGGLTLAAGAGGRRNRDKRQHRSAGFAHAPVVLHPPSIGEKKIAAFRRVHAAAAAQAHDRVDPRRFRHFTALVH